MNMTHLVDTIKKHPNFDQVGMVLCHNGVVRGTSHDGRSVSGLKIIVDHEKLRHVIESNKKKPGITEILVDIADNRELSVGDDVMLLVVAGDFRENVVTVLTETLNAIKTTVTKKTDFLNETSRRKRTGY